MVLERTSVVMRMKKGNREKKKRKMEMKKEKKIETSPYVVVDVDVME